MSSGGWDVFVTAPGTFSTRRHHHHQEFLLKNELRLIATDVAQKISDGKNPADMTGKWPLSTLADGVCARARARVCVCVRAYGHIFICLYVDMFIYVYILIF